MVSKLTASKAAIARIKSIPSESLIALLKEKQTGVLALAMKDLATVSEVDCMLQQNENDKAPFESMSVTREFVMSGSGANFFEEIFTGCEPIAELLAA